jgi:UDP-N-acetyl-D-mannosaminuronic acid dehydrogenase
LCMPAVLRLMPEEVDTVEKRGNYTVSVIGCGEKGVLYAVAFAEAGYKVICADADQSLVRRLARGKTPFSERDVEVKLKSFVRTGQLSTTSEVKNSVSQSDIVVITLTAKIDERKNSDYSEVENGCKQVGAALRRGALVIYGGTAGFGFTDGVVKEVLENTSGFKMSEDFGLVYTPVQVSNGQATDISNQELTVAADDKVSLEAASVILGTVTKKSVKQVLSVKTAELAALFAVARRDANVALANELAILCEDAGVDYFEAFKLVVPSAGEGFVPTIAAEDGMDEAYLLLENAENLGAKLRLTVLARQVNESVVKHVVSLVQGALRGCGKTLRRARVAVLGAVGPKTMAETLVKLLEAKGAKVSVYDPLFVKREVSDVARVFRRSFNEAVEGVDCMVLLAEHDQFKRLSLKKLRAVMRMPAAIVDLAGKLEFQKVEKEGFIYRGLGRGVEKK